MLEFLIVSILTLFLFIFTGLGLSFLLCPVRFEKYSLFFAPFIGISYLSFSGWVLANFDRGGVDNYWSLLLVLPIISLLLSVFWKKQRIFEIFWPFHKENLPLLVICVIIYLCISYPSLISLDFLTTTSLGNNDIALYAAVSKFLMQSSLSHINPSLDSTVQLYAGNIDTLFASSLPIAYTCSILGIEPYQIINIIINIFFIFCIAFTFIISYELFNYSKTFSFILAFLTGFSIHLIYILYHGFFAQVLGMGIFLTLTFIIYYPIISDKGSIRSFFQYLPFAIILSLGLIAIYAPLVPLFIIPLSAFLILLMIAEHSIMRLKNELLYLLSVLFCDIIFFSILLYPILIIHFFEKFLYINTLSVGWRIPFLSPDWIFGLVWNNTTLAQTLLIPRFVLSVIILSICFYSMKSLYADNKKLFLFSISNLIFVLIFYIFLISQEAISPTFTGNGYKAYKLITYFLPIILISCLYFFKNHLNLFKNITKTKVIVFGLLGLLLVGNIVSAFSIISTSKDHLEFVSKDMADLGKINKYPAVNSINIEEPGIWNQMWIYYFLFDKHTVYLKYPSYYASSPQNGEWTLKANTSDILSILNFTRSSDIIPINENYSLERNRSCTISFYKGWYNLESNQDTQWRWSGEGNDTPSIKIDCRNEEQIINVRLNYKSLNPENTLFILMDGVKVTACSNNYCEMDNRNISKGGHILSFESELPPQLSGTEDPRYLDYAFSKIVISKTE